MSNQPNRLFLQHVISLTTGTSIAQAIPVVISPVLTRIYEPDAFGLYALYTTLAGLLAIAATGRFDLAIVLPKGDSDAYHLVWLSILTSAVVSAAVFLIAMLFSENIALMLGEPRIAHWLLLMPVSVLLAGSYSALNYWLNRHRQYSLMGRNRIAQTASTGAGQLGLGSLGVAPAGLILGNVIGNLLAAGLLAKAFAASSRVVREKRLGAAKLWELVRRYRNHPLHILPAQWASMAALQIPIVVISKLAGASVVGLYSVALYLITIPTNLLATAIGDVYRERASVAYREAGEFRSLYLTTIWFAFRVSILPLAFIFLLAPQIFAFALGESWRSAGEFARLLTVSAFFQFVFTSVDKGAVIVGATTYIASWCFVRLLAFAVLGLVAVLQDWRVDSFVIGTIFINSMLYVFDAAYQFRLSHGKPARDTPT